MATKKQLEARNKKLKEALASFKGKLESKPAGIPEDTKYNTWYKHQKDANGKPLEIVESGLKVKLPTKAGLKEFDAVKLSNNKVAVYVSNGSVLKYPWN